MKHLLCVILFGAVCVLGFSAPAIAAPFTFNYDLGTSLLVRESGRRPAG